MTATSGGSLWAVPTWFVFYRCGFYAALGRLVVSVSFRIPSDIITRATPLMIMLTPTKVPIAQAELDGQ